MGRRDLDYQEFPNGEVRLSHGEASGSEGIRVYENGYVETIEYGSMFPPNLVDKIKPNRGSSNDGI